jgi:hypothetical protein
MPGDVATCATCGRWEQLTAAATLPPHTNDVTRGYCAGSLQPPAAVYLSTARLRTSATRTRRT